MEHSDISDDIDDEFDEHFIISHEYRKITEKHFLEMISSDIFKMIHTSPYSNFA